MKKLLILLMTLFLTTSLYAVQKEQIVPVMTAKITDVLNILQDKKVAKEDKPSKIFSLMDELFDYKLMSRISLGKAWKGISTSQQDEFMKRFENKLKQSYIDKLELYTDEKVEVIEAQQVKKNRIQLLTNVIGKDEVYKINYKFYKTKNDEWFIYDVDIIGVSIIQTYRKQFAGFLKDKPFDELLKTL